MARYHDEGCLPNVTRYPGTRAMNRRSSWAMGGVQKARAQLFYEFDLEILFPAGHLLSQSAPAYSVAIRFRAAPERRRTPPGGRRATPAFCQRRTPRSPHRRAAGAACRPRHGSGSAALPALPCPRRPGVRPPRRCARTSSGRRGSGARACAGRDRVSLEEPSCLPAGAGRLRSAPLPNRTGAGSRTRRRHDGGRSIRAQNVMQKVMQTHSLPGRTPRKTNA